ncbi:hypothetical protein QZH41_018565 [Actinostola sp. cb2023]|nr:hypothetical protein QZH41_018565 [Actinostola sp. cb2023]
MRTVYRPYVPTPAKLKANSDASLALADDLKRLKVNKQLLKIRERRMLSLAKHFLEYHFGSPYQDNYYTGAWMSGPGRQCSSEGIAYVRLQVATIFLLFAPGNTQVLEQVFASLRETGEGVRQYHDNVRRGVVSGMVNTQEDCTAGIRCLQFLYEGFGVKRDGKVILSWFHPNSFVFNMTKFLSYIHANPSTVQEWKRRHNSTLEQSVKRVIVEHVGRPLDELMYYLKNVHPLNCIPKGVIHGLASRPVRYVYYNGSRTNQRTRPYLDAGEIMHGSGAYGQILSYFTTLPYSPGTVNRIGWKMVRQLYAQTIEVAKNITGIHNTDEAVREFTKYINRPEMFLNEKPFPANESDQRAHDICSNVQAAKKFCPVRYATMQKWFKVARKSIAHVQPWVDRLFYHTGPKKTKPSCSVDVQMSLDPAEAVQSYQSSQSWCEVPASYNIPFFVDRMGPIYTELAVSAHEAWPGHHLQIQGYLENFRDTCPSSLDLLDDQQYTAFTEGWGMYAENPVASLDMGLFDHHQLEWYGMLKAQLWRALRLIIDTGLHHRGMSRNEAVTLFRDYLWETGDVPEKEVSRYQSWAGQAATYMTGQLALWDMRNSAEKQLGKKFDLKEFHYQILRHGQVPMDFLKEHIEIYTQCVLDDTKNAGCQEMLGKQKPAKQKSGKPSKSREMNERRILKLRKFLGHVRSRRYPF